MSHNFIIKVRVEDPDEQLIMEGDDAETLTRDLQAMVDDWSCYDNVTMTALDIEVEKPSISEPIFTFGDEDNALPDCGD
jgi:hypothetical protein